MNRLKTSTKLILLAVFASALIALLGIIGVFQMNRMADSMMADLRAAKVENEALVAVENAQAHFKTQVQEWKNILLRGNDSANFDRYLKQFGEEETRVQEYLAAAEQGMSASGLAIDGVRKLLADHVAMGGRYRSALEQFDRNDPDAGKVVDKLVRGMDRDASAGMASIVSEIEAHFAERVDAQIAQAEARYESARNIFVALSATGLLLIIGLCVAVLRDMLGQLGGEPAYAANIARRIAAGDLTTTIDTRTNDKSSLLVAMKQMRDSQREVIAQIQQAASRLAEAAGQMSRASGQVSLGSGRQNEAATAMATSVEEMSASIRHVASNANEVHSMAAEAGTLSSQGGGVVKNAVAEINKIADSFNHSSELISSLSEQSGRISAIVNVIKEIAEQTNLLALNAAIEAARAGEQGRGFAVVADEVRKLAERTAIATQEVGGMIQAIQNGTRTAMQGMTDGCTQVDEGVRMAAQAGDSMVAIESSNRKVLNAVVDISATLQEQSAASSQIADNVEKIARMTEENDAAVRNVNAAAGNVESLSSTLQALVGRFKVA